MATYIAAPTTRVLAMPSARSKPAFTLTTWFKIRPYDDGEQSRRKRSLVEGLHRKSAQ
ncbi:hypothetical protein J2W42_004373 [Rhizobium tibeticum]|uniref:hypothetical protein n=1 Tax=Rhizobium tibeticum TaxID=501024 RepID=UPI00278830DD|nr:hypothetical protein [Rhizobium tibeticum]MDP9811509.1 hypothetical protein [Rhizobium tibeticum]